LTATSPRLERALDDFLFAPTNSRQVGRFRLLFAAMLAWAFWYRPGMEPRTPWPDHAIVEWSFANIFLTPAYAVAVLLVIALFAAGIQARPTGLLLVAMLLPLAFLDRGQQSRQVLLVALIAFSFLRSDAALSLRSRRGAFAATAGPAWPIRLMQLQLSMIYLVNAMAKSTGAYLGGDVLIGMARMRSNIHVDLSDGYLTLGPLAIPVPLAAMASVATEYFLAVAFWIPGLRLVATVVGIAFHGFLTWMMSIFMLDWVTIFLYLVFLMPLIGAPGQEPDAPARR
jgi:hypothetical protein